MKKTVFIFPGAHKTGTTLLQQGLRLAVPFLKQKGFVVAKRQKMYRSGLHNFILNGVPPKDGLGDTLSEVFDTDEWESYNLIISLENIFGEALPGFYGGLSAAVAKLADIFPSHEMRVCLYVRRQDEFVESLYLQSLHDGGMMTFEDYQKEFLRKKTMDWCSLISEAELVLGKANIVVRPYDLLKTDPRQYMVEFFEQFCPLSKRLQVRIGKGAEKVFTNRSLSLYGVEVSLCAFRYIREASERKLFVKELREIGYSSKQEKFKIPEQARHQIAAANLSCNRLLVDRLGLIGDLQRHYLFHDVLEARSGNAGIDGN